EMMGLDQYRAVTDVLGGFGVPIVMDADIGHLPPAMPLLMGSYASVTADEKITITMKV
ncbi:MAG: LD-carboxypeptidase, partial [Lachnospiraceae bacterium]|nr:LD-carboxypeptidase [Lachnospiraceae bacterium]